MTGLQVANTDAPGFTSASAVWNTFDFMPISGKNSHTLMRKCT